MVDNRRIKATTNCGSAAHSDLRPSFYLWLGILMPLQRYPPTFDSISDQFNKVFALFSFKQNILTIFHQDMRIYTKGGYFELYHCNAKFDDTKVHCRFCI